MRTRPALEPSVPVPGSVRLWPLVPALPQWVLVMQLAEHNCSAAERVP